MFALAWSATSLSLHHLLQFYRERPNALLAARKKFIISRLGDACLILVLILTRSTFGTWNLAGIFQATAQMQHSRFEPLPASINWICLLLVFAALLKSAQFPFHSWLPDTMETPTPVSALMHAGIINAGGILILKLSPLISLSSQAMLILCLVGAFTSVFASVVMLTQASIKRCLAFSTVAQMGFMMLECGLGAFHLALLHLVAHSFYKAYAFLSTGSAVRNNPQKQDGPVKPHAVAVGLLFAAAICAGASVVMNTSSSEQLLPAGVFSLALAQMLWNLWAHSRSPWFLSAGLATTAAMAFLYFGLERVAGEIAPPIANPNPKVGILILPLFFCVAILQTQLPSLSRTKAGRRLYVHARNGYYVNSLANRITALIWPVRNAAQEVL